MFKGYSMDRRYVIKVVTGEDIDGVVRMRLSLQEHLSRRNSDLWKLSPKRASELSEFYRKMMSNKGIRMLVIHDAETKSNVGMGLGRIQTHDEFVPSKSGRIDDIWIDPAHRRKGLCTSLVSHLVEFFTSSGISSLTLEYVEGNHEAEQTWTRFSFRSVLKTANAALSAVEEKCKRSKNITSG